MNMKKIMAMLLAVLLIVTATVAGTVAWLTAQDTPVTNTFNASTIGVDLKEHTYDATTDKLTSTVTDEGVSNYTMIPGWTIPKDPEAWITEHSVDAYLFVKVEETENFDDYMTYAIADGWTLLTGVIGLGDAMTDGKINTVTNDTYVIYREVAAGDVASAMDQANAFQILAEDKLVVIDTVDKDLMTAAGTNKPSLTFTAYAHQLYRSSGVEFDATVAWKNLNP